MTDQSSATNSKQERHAPAEDAEGAAPEGGSESAPDVASDLSKEAAKPANEEDEKAKPSMMPPPTRKALPPVPAFSSQAKTAETSALPAKEMKHAEEGEVHDLPLQLRQGGIFEGGGGVQVCSTNLHQPLTGHSSGNPLSKAMVSFLYSTLFPSTQSDKKSILS